MILSSIIQTKVEAVLVTNSVTSSLPSLYYLMAHDKSLSWIVEGVVFKDIRSPLRWLAENKQDPTMFSVQAVDVIYYPSNIVSTHRQAGPPHDK